MFSSIADILGDVVTILSIQIDQDDLFELRLFENCLILDKDSD